MKYINRNTSIFSFFAVTALCIMLSACSKKITFNNSSVVPAAEGKVKIKKDKNSNYSIEIKVNRLANSDRLTPPKDVYVLWMEGEKNVLKNLGQLKSSSSMISKSLKASFKTVVPFKPSKIFITAEDNADVLSPGSQVVLTTDNF